ncbi:hypothetical protein [uncultured Christiangramia sp.]|uniref:hypothetical protein n=1 Tax=uncultured Christiangramia sp. TaxID=503836 RepID=UPI0026179453|nr:hypothetical protein [uncultured Christiangramia sp.]
MLFYKWRRKIRRILKKKINYYSVLWKTSKIPDKNKILWIDVSGVVLNRYLFCFLKFFELEGYTIYFPKKKELINALCETGGEISWCLKDKFLKFSDEIPGNSGTLVINRSQLSNDYFSDILNHNEIESRYYIPMCEYPTNYYSVNNEEIDINLKRKQSIFMAGNMDPKYYSKISSKDIFNIISRREVVDHLYLNSNFLPISSYNNLNQFITSELDKKLILIDTIKDFRIKNNLLKSILSKFDFFLALPGIEIPQSHNVIEAISMGCIPVIQKSYAELFSPPLENQVNAIIFNNFTELDNVIEAIFNLNYSRILELRINVLNYNYNHLIPKAIVEKVKKNDYEKIFIQAEISSLKFLNRSA